MTTQLICPACKAELPRGAEQCPACGAKVPQAEVAGRAGQRHKEHGRSARASRRYVYGKRKAGLSAEMIWLLLVLLLGLLLILGVHLLAYMRARKLVEAPPPPPTAVVLYCRAGARTPPPFADSLRPCDLSALAGRRVTMHEILAGQVRAYQDQVENAAV